MTGGLPRMTMILLPRCQPSAGWSGWDWILRARGWREMMVLMSKMISKEIDLNYVAYLIWYHTSHTTYVYDIYHIIWYLSHLYNIPTFAAWNRRDMLHVLFLFLGNRYSNSRCRKERFESLWDAEHVSVHPGNWRGTPVWSDPSKTDVKFLKLQVFDIPSRWSALGPGA